MLLTLNELDKLLTLTLYPVAILGATINRAKLVGFIDADAARQWIDPAALHANVYGTLPVGVPNDHRKYYYAKFILENGTVMVLGLPWIESFTVHTESTIVVTITGIDPVVDIGRVRAMCLANGFNTFNVDIV